MFSFLKSFLTIIRLVFRSRCPLLARITLIRNVPIYLQSRRVIAIRREDQSVWERRAPFSPSNVKTFVRQGVKVIVQPSNRRAYPMQVKN